MIEVTYEVHSDDKNSFFNRHNWDYEVETSPMADDGSYVKTYTFADKSVFFERMSPVEETVDVCVHGVKIETKVKLSKITYWTSETTTERCFFERW